MPQPRCCCCCGNEMVWLDLSVDQVMSLLLHCVSWWLEYEDGGRIGSVCRLHQKGGSLRCANSLMKRRVLSYLCLTFSSRYYSKVWLWNSEFCTCELPGQSEVYHENSASIISQKRRPRRHWYRPGDVRCDHLSRPSRAHYKDNYSRGGADHYFPPQPPPPSC